MKSALRANAIRGVCGGRGITPRDWSGVQRVAQQRVALRCLLRGLWALMRDAMSRGRRQSNDQ